MANENQQQPLEGSLPPAKSTGEPATKEQRDAILASLDQKMEEHRLKTAKGFYQEERKRAETLLDTQRTAWGMPTLAEESAHTNTSSEPAFWARILAEKGFADFGFVLFRLDYTNQSRWDAWFRTFDDIAEASMDATTRRSDVEVELV